MLLPPRNYLIPLFILDALLDPALLNCFTGIILEDGISNTYAHPTRTRIYLPSPLPLFLFLGETCCLGSEAQRSSVSWNSRCSLGCSSSPGELGLADRVAVPNGFDVYSGRERFNRLLA
jgi:hypothetical protein